MRNLIKSEQRCPSESPLNDKLVSFPEDKSELKRTLIHLRKLVRDTNKISLTKIKTKEIEMICDELGLHLPNGATFDQLGIVFLPHPKVSYTQRIFLYQNNNMKLFE